MRAQEPSSLSVMSAKIVACAVAVGMTSGAARAGDPRPGAKEHRPPRLERTTAAESQAQWNAVKQLGSAGTQLVTIDKKHLLRKSCDDLVDLRALWEGKQLEGFIWRDFVRGRTWARPTMALLLSEAMRRFQKELPGRVIAIGDVSQPGCGQIAHGVLVQEVNGKEAIRLLQRARLEAGVLTVSEIRTAKDFPWESDRFEAPDERVLVSMRLLAQAGDDDDPTLRVARTRFREQPAPTPQELEDLDRTVAKLMRGTRVRSEKVVSEDPAGVRMNLWSSHWVSASAGRQLVLVTRSRPRNKLDWGDVREVRVATWQDKKPGSFPDEVRWIALDPPAPEPPAPVSKKGKGKSAARATPIEHVRLGRWMMMYEAGHITHVSGIDADLSYVTVGDTKHFAVDLEAMDVAATWRWFEILEETGRALGTPVDAILVDPKVKRRLQAALPASARRTKAWRLLTLVGGHDAHHHLRIVEPAATRERQALVRLK